MQIIFQIVNHKKFQTQRSIPMLILTLPLHLVILFYHVLSESSILLPVSCTSLLLFFLCISKFRVEYMAKHFRTAFRADSVLDLCLQYRFFLVAQLSVSIYRSQRRLPSPSDPRHPPAMPLPSFLFAFWVLHLFVCQIPLLLIVRLWRLWMFHLLPYPENLDQCLGQSRCTVHTP